LLTSNHDETGAVAIGNASTEDREVLGNWSPELEIADEINNASEDKEDVAVEVPEETVKENASTEDHEVLGNCSNREDADVLVGENREEAETNLNSKQSASTALLMTFEQTFGSSSGQQSIQWSTIRK
jgi:hypothetical protein